MNFLHRSRPLLALAAFVFLPVPARAGAWLREPGEMYSKLTMGRQTARKVFAVHRDERLPADPRTDDSVSVYSEYGLSDKWTVIGSAEARRAVREMRGPSEENTGVTDAWFFAKRGLIKEPFVLSLQGGVKVPLGYSRRATVPLGDGQIDYEARVLAGKGLRRAYAGAELGYRKRCGDFSDELPFRLETGVWAAKAVLLKATLDGVQSRTNDVASSRPFTDKPANVFDKEYMDFSPSVAIFFAGGYGFEVFYRETIAGANASVYRGWGVGLSWQGRPRWASD